MITAFEARHKTKTNDLFSCVRHKVACLHLKMRERVQLGTHDYLLLTTLYSLE